MRRGGRARSGRAGTSAKSCGHPHLLPADWADVRATPIRPDGHVAWASGDSRDTALVNGLTSVLATT
ncbi:hypothetical protein ABZ922_41665 [Streptomyces shenzhenensis]|uniref:hypothetical protein n=1 Tax=Streptomyces shenzhenensis TaxID=943815 RepID=UPI00340A2F1A